MREPGFQGVAGRTVAESTPWWPDPPASAPNVLMVVLDDTGWSDLGCYGSEIATPAVDALADDGLRYANFHVTPLCSPTRACLLTGRNHHDVGMRFLADTDTGFPNSRGRVRPDVPMVPELLRERGYGTYLVGKWHLAPLHEITPAGPHHNWPLGRGFDRFYGFLDGCTDQYTPELYEDNHQVEPPDDPAYHLSADLADRAIRYVTDHVSFRPGRPFYLQLALGATHAPFEAPRAYIERYVEEFTKGWDATRRERLRRQIAGGLVPGGTDLCERDPDVPAWDDLDDDRRRLYAHLQAAFAGFLHHADDQIGRVVAALDRLGIRENTLVMVMSDNGASREGGPDGAVDTNAPYSRVRVPVAEQLRHLDDIGGPEGPAFYPEGWAMAGNTPFRRYKQYVDLGGVRAPLVVSWPAGIAATGVRRQFAHAVDVAATVLDVAGVAPPAGVDRRRQTATFADPRAPTRDTQYWEMLGHRAIWHRGWKAVTEHVPGVPYERDTWRLYDTTADFSESRDVAAAHHAMVGELQRLWWREAEANDVCPLDDRGLADLIRTRGPQGLVGRTRLELHAGCGHVPFASAVTGSNRTMWVTARLRGRRAGQNGVLVSSGSSQGGYVLYLLDGVLRFDHHFLGDRVTCAAGSPAPTGDHTVGFRLSHRTDGTAQVTLVHDGEAVSEAELPRTSGHLAFWGLDVGRDAASPVSPAYARGHVLPEGVLDRVIIEFPDAPPPDDLAATMERTE